MSRTPPAHRRPRAALAMGADAAAAVLSPGTLAALAEVCTLAPLPAIDDFTTEAARAVLADTEVLVTGWGCPPIHAGVLAAAPELRAVSQRNLDRYHLYDW